MAGIGAITLLIVLFIGGVRFYQRNSIRVATYNMLPNLEVGSIVEIDRDAYKSVDPKLGDVVVFHPPKEQYLVISRVVGLPGDSISFLNDRLVINGKSPEVKFIKKETVEPDSRTVHVALESLNGQEIAVLYDSVKPEKAEDNYYPALRDNKFFVAGDNRDNSVDSRTYGPIPKHLIVGKVVTE